MLEQQTGTAPPFNSGNAQMADLNTTRGLFRLYVVWCAIVATTAIAAFAQTAKGPGFVARAIEIGDWAAIGILAPLVVFFPLRWVLRGFKAGGA